MAIGSGPRDFDDIDRRLLDELQHDADRPLHVLGDIVGLSPSATSRRIARYKRDGAIERTVAVIDPSRAGVALQAVCNVVCKDDSIEQFGALKSRLTALPEVVHCYEVAGTLDLIAVFAVPNMATYTRLTREHLASDPNVHRFESHIVIDVVKTTSALPL